MRLKAATALKDKTDHQKLTLPLGISAPYDGEQESSFEPVHPDLLQETLHGRDPRHPASQTPDLVPGKGSRLKIWQIWSEKIVQVFLDSIRARARGWRPKPNLRLEVNKKTQA